MLRPCIINGCPSVSGKNLGLFYYRLPKEDVLKNRWMSMITPKPGIVLNEDSLICSRHFKEMDYVNYTKRILRKNAVPTMVPLIDQNQQEDTVDEIKSEQSSTDCESDSEMVPREELVEDIKVEEMDTSTYAEDSTIRVVDVESILKNQVDTSTLGNTTAAMTVQPQHMNLNQMQEQTLREAFKNFTGNTNAMTTQRNAPEGVSTIINNNNNVNSLSNFIYVSQQQQQSPSSLLIELLPLSFPQTSQEPLAIQPTQQIQPIQQNAMVVRPVYVQDKKLNQPRLVGTEIRTYERKKQATKANQQVALQNMQPIVLPQNAQPILLPQNAQPIVLPQNGQPIVLPQNAQPIVLPQNVQPIVLPQNAQPIVVSQNVQPMVVPQTVQNVDEQNGRKITAMKSEAIEQMANTQTVEPEISSRHMNGGPRSKTAKKPQKITRNVGVSKKIAANTEAIKKKQVAFAKLKLNYEKLQKKYDEVRAILDLLKENKLNVEHIKDFYTSNQKRTKNDSVSCGVWWRGSGFVGTRPN